MLKRLLKYLKTDIGEQLTDSEPLMNYWNIPENIEDPCNTRKARKEI